MRIQIASDLHLEQRPKAVFRDLIEPSVAPILALLGDIAPLNHPNLRPFLEWCSERWETVIWIPGRIELLGPGSGNEQMRVPDLRVPLERMRYLTEPYWNITILDHEGMVSSDGVYIFGLPFWKFPNDEGYVWNPAFYRYVQAEPSPTDDSFLRRAYNEDLKWLKAKTSSQREPIVILSHYGPTTWIQEEGFVGDPDKSVVFPDIEEILRAPVVAWLCGHCHQSTIVEKEWSDAGGSKGTVLIANNPKGMPMENLAYRKDAVIRIDPTLYSIYR
jgi:hypothetical protein